MRTITLGARRARADRSPAQPRGIGMGAGRGVGRGVGRGAGMRVGVVDGLSGTTGRVGNDGSNDRVAGAIDGRRPDHGRPDVVTGPSQNGS